MRDDGHTQTKKKEKEKNIYIYIYIYLFISGGSRGVNRVASHTHPLFPDIHSDILDLRSAYRYSPAS